MRWINWRHAPPTTEEEEDHNYVDRVEKVTDLTSRLKEQRKTNGFGAMFDSAFRAPPRRGRHV